MRWRNLPRLPLRVHLLLRRCRPHSTARPAPVCSGKKGALISCEHVLAPRISKKLRVQHATDAASAGSVAPLKTLTQRLASKPQHVQPSSSLQPGASESSRVKADTRNSQPIETLLIKAQDGHSFGMRWM